MTSTVQRGSTLIELLFFIVVVSIGVVGILSVMNTTVRFSAEPMARKQAMVLAESILVEVIQKDYAEQGVEEGDASRDTMDDVDDYSGLTQADIQSIFTDLPAGYDMSIVVEKGVWNVGEDDWGYVTQKVSVEDLLDLGSVPVPLPLPVPAKKITVTVTSRGHTISLSGYRADY